MQGFPIQQAKVLRPPLRPATLHRERLVKWLDERSHHRLLFVTAEAGYGKTTLLADWARRAPLRVAWYRIEPDDANWPSFLRYLIASGREVDAEFAPMTSVLLDELAAGANNREIVRATFLHELGLLVPSHRVAFALDDAHLLLESRDVAALLSDLVNHGPDRVTWIIAGRRRPGIAVSRLRAVGEMHELRRQDLRFQRDEATELFNTTFERPMAPDLIDHVVERTEGWAASLRLIDVAIRDRSDAEVRTFIRSLTGSKGDLYDYLAEEVVGDLEPDVQEFLMRTSVMQVVTVPDINLVLETTPEAAEEMLDTVVALGLLDAAGPDQPDCYRYHPLVREFLEARLRQELGPDLVADLHRRLAIAHESTDWRTAAYHYEAIDALDDIQRILVASATSIMARGEFAIARNYASRLLGATNPALNIFESRVEMDAGDLRSALEHARSAYSDLSAAAPLRRLALANYMSISLSVGEIEKALELTEPLLAEGEPDHLRDIAIGTRMTLGATASDGRLDELQIQLSKMEDFERSSGLDHYLAITLINASFAAYFRSQPQAAVAKASEAIELLGGGSRRDELNAAIRVKALALAHLGQWEAAVAALETALGEADGRVRTEALVEAAECWISYGDVAGAEGLLRLAAQDPVHTQASEAHLPLAEAELLIRQGRVSEAKTALKRVPNRAVNAFVFETRAAFVSAWLSLASNHPDAPMAVELGLSKARMQRSEHFIARFNVLKAAAGPAQQTSRALEEVAALDTTYFSMVAEAVVPRLGEISEGLFRSVQAEVAKRPARWRELLRATLAASPDPHPRAGILLESIGQREDLGLLRAVSRLPKARRTNRRLGLELARRLAPRILIEDMGRIRVRIGSEDVQGLDARRKVLEVICYLLTRPGLSATRDEVLDAVWPDSDPPSALNSLNQTLYFLRRVFEADYVERSISRLHPPRLRHYLVGSGVGYKSQPVVPSTPERAGGKERRRSRPSARN